MKNNNRYTYYIAAAIAFILVNYLMSQFSLKLDFSKNRAHTLSNSTKQVLRNLKDPVSITFYSSSALPSRLQPAKREVTDLLNDYKSEGKNKITILVKDPKKDQKAKQEATNFGIPELNFSQQEQDRFAVTTGYFGIGLTEKDKKASIPQVANIGDLEYNLTAAIYKISITSLPEVGVMGNDSPEQQFITLRQAGASQFAIKDVATPSASLKTLIVIDDHEKQYTEEETTNIEKYIRGGGKAIFMTDGVWVSGDLQSSEATHGLFALLRTFGITLNKNLVLSTAAEVVNFGVGGDGSQVLTAYPYWVRTQTFDRSNTYFSNVRQLTFPWTSSLSLASPTGVQLNTLVRTVPTSWEQTSDFTLNPSEIKQPNQKSLKQVTLIASAKLANGGQLMVIPSSRFVEDQFLSQSSSNLDFMLNVMSDYAAGGALSGIRQRSVDLYPIPPDLSNQQKDVFKYLTILLLPLAFAAYGVFHLVKRK